MVGGGVGWPECSDGLVVFKHDVEDLFPAWRGARGFEVRKPSQQLPPLVGGPFVVLTAPGGRDRCAADEVVTNTFAVLGCQAFTQGVCPGRKAGEERLVLKGGGAFDVGDGPVDGGEDFVEPVPFGRHVCAVTSQRGELFGIAFENLPNARQGHPEFAQQQDALQAEQFSASVPPVAVGGGPGGAEEADVVVVTEGP